MSSLIVIRITPQQTLEPGAFTGYLNPAGLGPLQITAFELTFDDPIVGRFLGTVTVVAKPTPPTPMTPKTGVPPDPPPVLKAPKYSSSPTSGIVQQYDLAPAVPSDSAYFELEAVATAVIEVPAPAATKIENLRLVAQWGSGAGATPVPIDDMKFYGV